LTDLCYFVLSRFKKLIKQIPHFYNDAFLIRGKVGRDISVEEAYEAAKSCALALLGTLKAEVDDLDLVQIVKISGFINCVEDFTEHSKVMNGASDFLVEVLGPERGRHCRIGTSFPSQTRFDISSV
jgi:enamine deaminase RidA (YjgF/YER057c/UK114 family)